MDKVYNWGRYPVVEAQISQASSVAIAARIIKNSQQLIARGMGRSYGDSSLAKHILSTLKMNKFIAFDLATATLRCEAGVLLADILKVIVPKGFFLPVVPGTKRLTVGGMIAVNAHGKNHTHSGAFGDWLLSFQLLNKNGELLNCSPKSNPDLFQATIGGMGLSGVITTATLQLKRIETAFLKTNLYPAKNLKELLRLYYQHQDAHYAVAWIDGLATGNKMGRGVLQTAEHCAIDDLMPEQLEQPLVVYPDRAISIPDIIPSFALNKLILYLNNYQYLQRAKRSQKKLVHYDSYFFPLDKLRDWNRLYGSKGFVQYQFVLPLEHAANGLENILQLVARSSCSPYLSVLKKMGSATTLASPLSFPMPGYSLALDFKMSNTIFALLDELDKVVLKHRGKIYLAKDARMSASTFRASYAQDLEQSDKFQSLQSLRLST